MPITPLATAILLALAMSPLIAAAQPDVQPPVLHEYQPKPEETWLLERLAELKTLKPGVSIRDDVDSVLEPQRGLYTREQQRYALTTCRYIHVTVTYKPNPTDDLSRDVVDTISEPTLADH